jgi:hypothetical protein
MAKHTPPRARDRRDPGWFWVDNSIIDRYGADLGPIGIALYAALARHADRDGRAFPAFDTLAKLIGTSRRTAITYLQRMEALGVIAIDAQTDAAGNPIAANIYTLCAIPQQSAGAARGGCRSCIRSRLNEQDSCWWW